jgi:hypothetical protein
MQQDKAIIKCEYAMAAFSTGTGAFLVAVGLSSMHHTHLLQWTATAVKGRMHLYMQ